MKKNLFSKWLFVIFVLPATACQGQLGSVSRQGSSNSQEQTKTKSCPASGEAYINYYRYQQNYIPAPNQGIKTIKIGLHFWNDNQGNGTFSDTPETREQFDQIFFWINRWHEIVGEPSDPVPGAATITDTRIRFEIVDLYFYQDSLLNMTSDLNKLNNYVQANYPERLSALSIHFTSHDGIGSGHSSGTQFQNDKDICGIVTEVKPPPTNGLYSTAQHLFHEIAHSLGLHHTYNSEACYSSNIDFLYDVFDTTAIKTCKNSCTICYHVNSCNSPFDSPTDFCTNNVMSGKGSTKYWISPLQAGRIHRSTCMYSIRQYTWGYDSIPHLITQNETWDFSFKSYRDIVVKPGATLTIQCDLQMIPEARIIIEPGAQLVVDGGSITLAKYAEIPYWKGIEVYVKKRGKKKENSGLIQVINGGKIDQTKDNGLWLMSKSSFKKSGNLLIPIPVSE